MGDELTLTRDELEKIVGDAAKTGAAEAIRAANVPNPDARPGGGSPTILIRKPRRPSFTKAIRASKRGTWKNAELERDLSQATREVCLSGLSASEKEPDPDDGFEGESFAWPTSPQAMRDVLETADIKAETPFGEYAVRAMTEGSSSITVTGAGNLVPPQFLSDEFMLAPSAGVIVPSFPGLTEIPVTAQTIYLPRESAAATFSMGAEAGTLTAADPTLTNQSVTIRKGWVYRQYSNELLADANPALDRYIQQTIKRDMDLGWDEEFLQGDGSSYSIYGLRSYNSVATITSGVSLGTNGRTPTLDDLKQAVYNLRVANIEPNFWAMHPRTLNTLSQAKDAEGRYILPELQAPPQLVPVAGTQFAYGSVPVAQLLGMPVFISSQISIAETVGTSTNCSWIALGNANFIKLLRRQAIEVMASAHVAFTTDQTAIRATARAALAVTQPLSLEIITGVRP